MRGIMSLYGLVIGVAMTIGAGDGLVKATISMVSSAVVAHKKGPISFGKLNQIFFKDEKPFPHLGDKKSQRQSLTNNLEPSAN
jgi:hypothetical protein